MWIGNCICCINGHSNEIEKRIGISSYEQLGKSRFMDIYPDFLSDNLIINQDVDFIEVDDLSMWKTEVLGFGQVYELKI